jgi:predicted lipoprotein with Yx(FWY)xxD motif
MPPRRHLLTVASAAATALVLASCGGGGSDHGASPGGASSPPAGGAAAVRTATSSLGNVVVDGGGRTLYQFAGDTGATSTCSGACAVEWPPFTASSTPKATGGVPASALSLVARTDGRRQVAIDGHPLYFFEGDGSAGQVNGQGLDDFGAKWFVVSPQGKRLTASAGSSSNRGGAGRGGYGL